MLVTSPSRLPEALLEPTHILPPSQEPKVVEQVVEWCRVGVGHGNVQVPPKSEL